MSKIGNRMVMIGGGGHCKSVLDTCLRLNIYDKIVIADPNMPVGTELFGCEVVGDDGVLSELYTQGFKNAHISIGCIGSTELRRSLSEKAHGIGFCFPSIVDLSAIVADGVTIGEGAFIGKRAVLNANSMIDEMAIINTGAIIEHDCYIGKYVHVAPGAIVCGGCEIDDDAFIGAGATVVQGIKIEKKKFIKAGEVVK